jgi:hypothetical protein
MREAESNELTTLPHGLLDDVLAALHERDREAVLLRFFEGQPFAAIGATLEMSEDAARMRVTRALEKIKTLFARKGITSSVAAVSTFLSQQVVAAPAQLAATVATSALVGTATIVATAAAGTKFSFITLMTTTKAIWFAGAVAAFAVSYTGYQDRETANRNDEVARLTQERDMLRDQLRQSKQRATASDQRAAREEQLQLELRQKLASALADKPKPSTSTQKPPGTEGERRAEIAKKMAQMKPLLEAGMPIKGAVVVTNEGNAVAHPVEFVMGKETAIESDNGTYLLKPTLNPEGTVKYEITLVKQTKDAGSGVVTKREVKSYVTQIPWDGFMLRLGDGGVMAFDPDLREP